MLSRKKLLVVAGLVTLGVGAGPATTSPVKPASASLPVASVETAAPRDPLSALLADGKTGCASLRDYACTFTHQARTGGVLSPEQVSEMRVRVQPFGIAIRTAKPESLAGQEMVYVERQRTDGKMKLRLAGTSTFLLLTTDDPKVLAVSRRPVTQLGMNGIMDTLNEVARREKMLNNPVEVFTSDYQFAGRPVTRYEVFTRRPHAYRTFFRAVVCIDKETKLPVRYEAYDEPRAGGPATGELMEVYSYSDIRTNIGIGDSVFAR